MARPRKKDNAAATKACSDMIKSACEMIVENHPEVLQKQIAIAAFIGDGAASGECILRGNMDNMYNLCSYMSGQIVKWLVEKRGMTKEKANEAVIANLASDLEKGGRLKPS